MTSTTEKHDLGIMTYLAPVVADNLDRHLSLTKEWFPHQFVPWSEGSNFDGPLGGDPWEPDQSRLSEHARASLILGLLGEDNLPSYFFTILSAHGNDGAWAEWVRQWCAEEARHSVVLRDYLHTTRAVDPIALERARMAHMANGYVNAHEGDGVLRTIIMLSMSELQARVVHRNTGMLSNDPICDRIMARLAADENLHMIFYRNLVEAALEIDPEDAMVALCDVITVFGGPAQQVPDFTALSNQFKKAGVYTSRMHIDAVINPYVRHLRLLDRTDLGPAGRKAQDRIGRYLNRIELVCRRFESMPQDSQLQTI